MAHLSEEDLNFWHRINSPYPFKLPGLSLLHLLVRKPCSRLSSKTSRSNKSPAKGVFNFRDRDWYPNNFLDNSVVADVLGEFVYIPSLILNKLTYFSAWISVFFIF